MNYSAGLGDALLLERGAALRGLLGIGGIGTCSPEYAAGQITGILALAIGTAGVEGAAATSVAAGNGFGLAVLGSYPAYVNLAEELGANYFSVPMEEWAEMTAAEQWAANQAFLDAAIARGDSFVFATELAPAGSFYEQELLYLQQMRISLGVPAAF